MKDVSTNQMSLSTVRRTWCYSTYPSRTNEIRLQITWSDY